MTFNNLQSTWISLITEVVPAVCISGICLDICIVKNILLVILQFSLKYFTYDFIIFN
jgi:hypothetical protein